MDPLDELTRDLDRFPTLPEVATRVIRMLENPDCDLTEVADAISLDPVLTGRIVQIASSPAFGLQMQKATLRQAILRLGIKETRSVVVSVAVMSTVPELPDPLDLHDFWTLGLGTALSARQLAIEFCHPEPEAAYLAGLVHSLGEAYLAVLFTDRFREAVMAAQEHEIPFERAIESEFGVGHPAVSAALLRTWGFPNGVLDAVAHHLRPDEAPSDKLLATVVFAADRICRDLGLAPAEPGRAERAWVLEIPREIISRIESLGYPDITYFLIEQREFLRHVAEFVRQTFAAA
jgi:HD-like signal output (HDOD) protein